MEEAEASRFLSSLRDSDDALPVVPLYTIFSREDTGQVVSSWRLRAPTGPHTSSDNDSLFCLQSGWISASTLLIEDVASAPRYSLHMLSLFLYSKSEGRKERKEEKRVTSDENLFLKLVWNPSSSTSQPPSEQIVAIARRRVLLLVLVRLSSQSN